MSNEEAIKWICSTVSLSYGGNMTKHLSSIDISNLPENLPLVIEKLEALKARVDELQKTLPRGPLAPRPTLEAARRDALKLKLELDGLEANYSETLALDMVDSKMHEQLCEVGEARKAVGGLYVECEALLDVINPSMKALRGKLQEKVLGKLDELHADIKAVLKEIQDIVFQTPELGMTFAEWKDLTLAERRSLRSRGRPTAPLEAQIIRTHRHLLDTVAVVNGLSGGKIRTVEEAIDGVELSKRGRPQVSELGKMDRVLANLRKRLEEVASTPSTGNRHDKKVANLMAQIAEMESSIAESEAELGEMESAKRQLEILRAKHRDMVVAEVAATGENQIALLMATIRNEDAQLDVIEKILKIDPEDRVTVTSKVNPKETRLRFDRLRMSGAMKDSEFEELNRLEHRQDSFAYSRNR
jgi:hypothetical protein